MDRADAIALAAEATDAVGHDDVFVAEIDPAGILSPTFAIVDPITGRVLVEGLSADDVIEAAVEAMDLADAVAADPGTYHPDTVAAHASAVIDRMVV